MSWPSWPPLAVWEEELELRGHLPLEAAHRRIPDVGHGAGDGAEAHVAASPPLDFTTAGVDTAPVKTSALAFCEIFASARGSPCWSLVPLLFPSHGFRGEQDYRKPEEKD